MSAGVLRPHVQKHLLRTNILRSFCLGACICILICGHRFPLTSPHLAWEPDRLRQLSSLSKQQQLAQAHAKAKCPEQGHQHRHTPKQNVVRFSSKNEKGEGHAPAAKRYHTRDNEALRATYSW